MCRGPLQWSGAVLTLAPTETCSDQTYVGDSRENIVNVLDFQFVGLQLCTPQ